MRKQHTLVKTMFTHLSVYIFESLVENNIKYRFNIITAGKYETFST